ncbi:hypothetical protein AB0424_17605 [Streptomyces sp. NPDC051180]|uniref:hypothetical protein n=1 Tax=Streptomyces sp. NPDC051180 TaxID=3155797 RepID=UPI0034509AD5
MRRHHQETPERTTQAPARRHHTDHTAERTDPWAEPRRPGPTAPGSGTTDGDAGRAPVERTPSVAPPASEETPRQDGPPWQAPRRDERREEEPREDVPHADGPRPQASQGNEPAQGALPPQAPGQEAPPPHIRPEQAAPPQAAPEYFESPQAPPPPQVPPQRAESSQGTSGQGIPPQAGSPYPGPGQGAPAPQVPRQQPRAPHAGAPPVPRIPAQKPSVPHEPSVPPMPPVPPGPDAAASADGGDHDARRTHGAPDHHGTPGAPVSEGPRRDAPGAGAAGRGPAQEAHPARPHDRAEDEEVPDLLGAGDQEAFRARWREVQGRFVDDPRQAVHAADVLVGDVMRTLADTFAQHRNTLEGQWSMGRDADTESLRHALRQYRALLHLLLDA